MPESRLHACKLKEEAMSYLKRIASNCAGCLGCALACSSEHFDYFDIDKSRIRIKMDEETFKIEIHQCIQCTERSCVEACPVGALTINEEFGYVKHDENTCLQCKKCFKACNYNGVYWDYERNYPLICDLCKGDPQCVKPCRLHEALKIKGKVD